MEGGIIRTRCLKVGSSAVPKTKLRGLESRLKRSFVLSGFEGMKVFFTYLPNSGHRPSIYSKPEDF